MAATTTAPRSARRNGPEPALPPGTGRAVLIGTAIGFALVGGFCAAVGAFAGLSAPGAIALGVFTGMWGGPGFGGMMGFVLFSSRAESAEAAARHRPAATGRPPG